MGPKRLRQKWREEEEAEFSKLFWRRDAILVRTSDQILAACAQERWFEPACFEATRKLIFEPACFYAAFKKCKSYIVLVMVFPCVWWRWSPPLQYTPFLEDPLANLGHMLVPAILLGLSMSAVTMRMTRTMMLEVLRQDYIRTARAKGLSENIVVFRHALRNCLIPVVTLIGLQAPLLIGGAVILEQIFVVPGMGLMLLEAVFQRDYPIVTGVFLVVGLVILLINLLVDLTYGFLDPKVRQ